MYKDSFMYENEQKKTGIISRAAKIFIAVMIVLLLSVTSAFASEYLVSQTDTIEVQIGLNEHRFLSAPVVDEPNCTYTWSYCAGVFEDLTQGETTAYINLPSHNEKRLEVDASMVQQYQISPNLAKFRCIVSNFDGKVLAELGYKVKIKNDIAKTIVGLISGANQTNILGSDNNTVAQQYDNSPNKNNGDVQITVKFQDEHDITISRDTIITVEAGTYFK